jgi:NhaA family Na+:H+ antiporter
MFSLLVFGQDHPAINFMLLLAILDDAIGMVIIAVFYGDPANPVEPVWLLLVLVAFAIGMTLRKLDVHAWWAYILVCAPFSWTGLMKAHVHPALALVFIVPCMPAHHALYVRGGECNLGACDLGPIEEEEADTGQFRRRKSVTSVSSTGTSSSVSTVSSMMRRLTAYFDDGDAPLHVFESTLKMPVDFGMFFFGLANAGVSFGSMGGLTVAVTIALCVGKMVGIFSFSVLASCLGFGLPNGLSLGDLLAMSALAGVGLTVALFLANEAYVQPELQDQAKMGAVFSVGCALVGWAIQRLASLSSSEDKRTGEAETAREQNEQKDLEEQEQEQAQMPEEKVEKEETEEKEENKRGWEGG